MIYFYSTKDEKATTAFERRAFDEERVLLASRLFQCIKIDADNIESKEAMSLYAATPPAIYFIGIDGKTDQVLKGPQNRADAVLGALAKTFDGDFTPSLTSLIEKERKLLDRLDKLETQLADVERDLTKANEKNETAKVQALTKERDALVKEREKLFEEEQALYEVRKKGQREVSSSN
jgi:hypothetical protein